MAGELPYGQPHRGDSIEADISTTASGSGSGHAEKKYGEHALGVDSKEGEATLHAAGGEGYIDAEKAEDVSTPRLVVDGESESDLFDQAWRLGRGSLGRVAA